MGWVVGIRGWTCGVLCWRTVAKAKGMGIVGTWKKYEKGFRDVWSGGGMDVEVHIEGPQGVCDPHVGRT